MLLKSAYYLFFSRIYFLTKAISDDGWEEWKAFIIVTCFQALILVDALVWITVLFRKGIDLSNPLPIVIPIGILVTAINYFALMHRDTWVEFNEKYANFPARKKRFVSNMTWLCLLLLASSLVLGFYQMSLVDWSKYRK